MASSSLWKNDASVIVTNIPEVEEDSLVIMNDEIINKT